MIYDTAIIGGGPAGIISAIQLKRSGFNVVLIEKNKIGGLLSNANKLENYLGFPSGISSKELIALFKKQLSYFDIKIIFDEVYKIKKSEIKKSEINNNINKNKSTNGKLNEDKLYQNKFFEIYTKKNCYKSLSVIIATGTTPKKADILGEGNLLGKKVFYEISDIPLTGTNKQILIIGGGDAAFDYAINLHENGHKPIIIMRNSHNCLNLLLKKAMQKKIQYFENIIPLRIYTNNNQKENKETNKIILECRLFNGGSFNKHLNIKSLKADFILIAVGREPNYPLIDTKNEEGLFFAGDIKNGIYRQLHIASGDAMQTAMKLQEYLKRIKNNR